MPAETTERPLAGVLGFGAYLLVWMLVAVAFAGLVSARTLTLLSTLAPSITAVALLRAYVGGPPAALRFHRPRLGMVVCTVLASLALVVPAMSLEALILRRFKVPQEVIDLLSEVFRAHSLPELAYVIAIGAVAAAICEEVVFRGMLQGSLHRVLRGWPAVLVTSLVFAALHDPWRLAAAFALGVFLGLLYWRTGSLVLAMISHFTINTVAILGLYVAENDGGVLPAWVIEERPAPWPLLAASLGAFAVLVALIWKQAGAEALRRREAVQTPGDPVIR